MKIVHPVLSAIDLLYYISKLGVTFEVRHHSKHIKFLFVVNNYDSYTNIGT